MPENRVTENHNIPQIILLHLLPGIPVLLIAILFSNPSVGFGFPFILSLFIAIAFGLIPCELSILFIAAKRKGGSVRDIIGNTERTPALRMCLWVLLLLTINGIAFATIPQLEQPLWTMFSQVPDWARISIEAVKSHPEFLYPTIILGLLMNGFLGPIVEEIYFRGYLLPRMGKLGKSAPLINTVLFSLYHLFAPWEIITRIIAVLPYAYAVWYKKNIRIGMFVHCIGNTLGLIGTIATLLS